MLACQAVCLALAVSAFAYESGEVWLNWAWEPATYGSYGEHAKWYYHYEQGEAEAPNAPYACSNGWYGSSGSWVFGQDWCSYGNEVLATPALRDPGVGAYPWVQINTNAAYTWAWAGYCGSC